MTLLPTLSSKSLFESGLKAESEQRYFEALLKYAAALELDTKQSVIWYKIGMMYLQIGKYYQASENLTFALQLDPENSKIIYGLAITTFYLGNLEESCLLIDKASLAEPNNHIYALDRANIRSIHNPDPQFKFNIYSDWGKRFADPLEIKKPFNYNRSPDRRLRIGYVSGDMRDHAIAFFMEPIFEHHNPQKVDVYVFSTSKEQDTVTERLKKSVPHWHNVSELNDDALCNLIRKNKIDVLIDLSGHTKGHRLFVFAKRTAPVQVTWLGYMGGTLGMKAMDYRLTDFGADPTGNEQYFVETLFRMRCLACYQPPFDCEIIPVPPMLSTGKPMLISLNSSRKVTDEMLLLWGKILEKRKDAQLFIQVQESTNDDAIATMEPRLKKAGLPLDRIILSPQVSLDEFMKSGGLADVALDTYPISGGTTTLHTLWMGLPIVTFQGHDATSSTTATTLTAFGLSKWVANNDDEYINNVLMLLNDPEVLTRHRDNIRSMMQNSRLMNYSEQCEELEGAYQRMWMNYLLGEKRFVRSRTPCEDSMEILQNNYKKK